MVAPWNASRPRREDSRVTAGTHSGRTVVITGASTGIGAATAIALAQAGAIVGIIDRDPAADTVAAIRAAGGTAASVQADIRDADAVTAAVAGLAAAHGPAQILVNNAGIGAVALLPIPVSTCTGESST